MILKMNRFSRIVTAILALTYIMSAAGIGSLIYQASSDYYAYIIFPCKGNGCACDKAGRELKGCTCDHTKKSTSPSCCSNEETSCCSTEQSSCCEEEQEEETCCQDKGIPTLKGKSCGGFDDSERYLIAKHVDLPKPAVNPRKYFYTISHLPYTKSIKETFLSPPEKVPIHI